MWWCLVLCISSAPDLLSSAWMFAYLLACMLDNLTVILFLMVVKSLRPFLNHFSKTIDFQYSYRSSVSVLISVLCYITVNIYCATTWNLIPACYHLTLIWYYLSLATCYIYTCLVIIILRESCNCYLALYAVTCIPSTDVLLYSWISEPDMLMLFP